MPNFQFEQEAYPYIFIDKGNNVQITYPISTALVDERIAISLDNTCKTGKVCKSFYENVKASVDNYIRHLTFDIGQLTGQQQRNETISILENKRHRLTQLKEWELLIHDLLALPHVSEMVGAHGTFLHFPSGIQKLLRNQTNIYGVYFRPKEEDSVLRVPNPACTFTRNSLQGVRAVSLGQALERIERIHITKNNTSSVKVEQEDFDEGVLVAVQNKYRKKLDNDKEVNNFLQDVKNIMSEQIKLYYPNAKMGVNFSWSDLSKKKLKDSSSWYDDYLDITNKKYLLELIETIRNCSLHIDDSLKSQYKSPFNKIDLDENNYQDKISINVQMFIFIANAIYCSKTNKKIDFAKLIEYEGCDRIKQFTSNLVNAFEGNNRADGDIEDFLLNALRDYLIPDSGLSPRKKQEFFNEDSFRKEIKERFTIFSNSILQGMERTMGTSHADEFLISFPDQKGDCITHQGNMCFLLSDFLKHQNIRLFYKYFSMEATLGKLDSIFHPKKRFVLQKNINCQSQNLPHKNPIGDDAYNISLSDFLDFAATNSNNRTIEMMASFLVHKVSDNDEDKYENQGSNESAKCFFETLNTNQVNLIKGSDLWNNNNKLQNKVLTKLNNNERLVFSNKFGIKNFIYPIEIIDQSLLYAYANDPFYECVKNNAKEVFAGCCESEAEVKAALKEMKISCAAVERREGGGFLVIFDYYNALSGSYMEKLKCAMSHNSMHMTRDMAKAVHKGYQVLFQNSQFTEDKHDQWMKDQVSFDMQNRTSPVYESHLWTMAIKYKLKRLRLVNENDIQLSFCGTENGYEFKCSNLEKSRQLMADLYKLCKEYSPRVPLTYAKATNLIYRANSQVVQEVVTPEILTDYFSRTFNENLEDIGHITRITQLPDKSFQIMMPPRPNLDQEKALTGLISEKLLYFYRLSGQQRKILPNLTDVKYHNVNDVTIVANLENIRKIEKSAPHFNNPNDEKRTYFAIYSIHDLKIYESLLQKEIDSYIKMKPEATVNNLIEYMKIFFPTIEDNVGNHIYSQFSEMLQASADNSSAISKNLSLAIEQLSSQTQIQEPEIIGNSDDCKEDYKPEPMLKTTIGNFQETDVAEAESLQELKERSQQDEAPQLHKYYPGKGISVSLLLGLLDLCASPFCLCIYLLLKSAGKSFPIFPISFYVNLKNSRSENNSNSVPEYPINQARSNITRAVGCNNNYNHDGHDSRASNSP